MSSCYNLGHVLDEIFAEKARVLTISRGQTPGAKVEIYSESWSSLNSWIESRLCKRKGASVPMLGSFTWEVKYGGDGSAFSRPIFIMSDSFIKEHRIRRQRVHVQPTLVPPEEINYSKLAIKFSKSLTKDMIFSGTRDIIKKIGDFVDRGYEFEIEFAFGVLKSKERQVRFEFNQARLAAILPENLRVGTMPQQPVAYDTMSESETASSFNGGGNQQTETRPTRPASSSAASSSSSAPFQNPAPSASASTSASASAEQRSATAPSSATSMQGQAPGQGHKMIPPLALPSVPASSGANVSFGGATLLSPRSSTFSADTASAPSPSQSMPQSPFVATNNNPTSPRGPTASQAMTMAASVPLFSSDYLPAGDRPISPGLQAVLMALEEHAELGASTKAELRERAKGRVDEAAYLRSLDIMESEAKFEEKTQTQAAEMQGAFEDGLKAKLEGQTMVKKTFRDLLDVQLAEAERRAKEDKQRRSEGKAAFFLPDSAGCVDNPPGALSGGPNYKTIKQNLFNDLTYQIRYNAERARVQKQQNLEEERDYLDHVAMELDLQHIAERVSHLEKQKALLSSWEREAHIRNLRKLQVAGAGAIKDYISVNLPDAADAQSAKQNPRFSIGYDFRKGKTTTAQPE